MTPETAATIKDAMRRIAQAAADAERKRTEAWLRFVRAIPRRRDCP